LAWQATRGIDGPFLASRVIYDHGQDLDRAEGRFDEQADEVATQDAFEDEEDAGGMNGGASKKERYFVRTYASLNMGLSWQQLKAPCDAKPDTTCTLHLAQWASAAAAPGIILGVGNAGNHLTRSATHHNVYMSRDAGLTWKNVLKGPHKVEILGHGDVFVAVPTTSPGSVLYSTNSGAKWEKLPLKLSQEQAAVVQSVFTHLSHTGLRAFVAVGSDDSDAATVAAADLHGVLTQPCQMDPTAVASDVEHWSPADALEDAHDSKRPACLLGIRTQYVRRKVDKVCRMGALPAAVDLRADTPCQCTKADYACDSGFYRESYVAGAACLPMEGVVQPNTSSLCAATLEDHVPIIRGYVKSPGNQCSGGVDLLPKKEACPDNMGISGALKGLLAQTAYVRMFMLLGLVGAVVMLQRQQKVQVLPLLFVPVRRCVPVCMGKKDKEEGLDDEEREFLLPGSDRQDFL